MSSKVYRKAACAVALILFLFILCSAALYSLNAVERDKPSGSGPGSPAGSFTPIQNKYSLLALPGKDPANTEIKLMQTDGKHLQSIYRAANYMGIKLLRLLPEALMIFSFLIFTMNINNHTSIIALRAGGHAPPVPSKP